MAENSIDTLHKEFEFDYTRNVIWFGGSVIKLTPREADIMRVLLNNRSRLSSVSALIQRVYGACEPDSAAVSIRVAIHSLRKKIAPTGIKIIVRSGIGYEIDASGVPELNRRLTDKILIALNHARARGEDGVANLLESALVLAEARRQKWDYLTREEIAALNDR